MPVPSAGQDAAAICSAADQAAGICQGGTSAGPAAGQGTAPSCSAADQTAGICHGDAHEGQAPGGQGTTIGLPFVEQALLPFSIGLVSGALTLLLALLAVMLWMRSRGSIRSAREDGETGVGHAIQVASMPASPVQISFSQDDREWLRAELRQERERMEERLNREITARVQEEVERAVQALRAVAESAQRSSALPPPPAVHERMPSPLAATEQRPPPAAEPAGEYTRVRARLKRLGDYGTDLMRRPAEFGDFRKEKNVASFKWSIDGKLETLPENAPRAEQIFWAVPDQETHIYGLFLGYDTRNRAEVIRANPIRFREEVSELFNVNVRGQKMTLVEPALLHFADGGYSVLAKGQIDV